MADHFHFNISHAGDYVVGVVSDGEVGCDIERNVNAPLEIAEHYFYSAEREYIEAASDPGKAFFTLWTLKESYMKMTGRGMSLPLDSFEIIRKTQWFCSGEITGKTRLFMKRWNLRIIFSQCAWKVIFFCRPRALQSFYDWSVFFAVVRHGLELIFSQKILKNYMQKT